MPAYEKIFPSWERHAQLAEQALVLGVVLPAVNRQSDGLLSSYKSDVTSLDSQCGAGEQHRSHHQSPR
jgi:hypothetical protein